MICPCVKCEKKGCGSYHDECEEYQEFRQGKIDVSRAKIRECEGFLDSPRQKKIEKNKMRKYYK